MKCAYCQSDLELTFTRSITCAFAQHEGVHFVASGQDFNDYEAACRCGGQYLFHIIDPGEIMLTGIASEDPEMLDRWRAESLLLRL